MPRRSELKFQCWAVFVGNSEFPTFFDSDEGVLDLMQKCCDLEIGFEVFAVYARDNERWMSGGAGEMARRGRPE